VETSAVGAVRAVDRAEKRIGALGGFEALADVERSDRHGVAWLMTRDTAAAIGAQTLKERIGGRVCRPTQVQGSKSTLQVREYLKLRNNPIGIVRGGNQSASSKKKDR